MIPERRDAIAEGVIVALVVVVLGVAAVRTKVPPGDDDVTRVAAQVRMSSPIGRSCLPQDRSDARACVASAPMDGH
jgi:hypothetical protein